MSTKEKWNQDIKTFYPYNQIVSHAVVLQANHVNNPECHVI